MTSRSAQLPWLGMMIALVALLVAAPAQAAPTISQQMCSKRQQWQLYFHARTIYYKARSSYYSLRSLRYQLRNIKRDIRSIKYRMKRQSTELQKRSKSLIKLYRDHAKALVKIAKLRKKLATKLFTRAKAEFAYWKQVNTYCKPKPASRPTTKKAAPTSKPTTPKDSDDSIPSGNTPKIVRSFRRKSNVGKRSTKRGNFRQRQFKRMSKQLGRLGESLKKWHFEIDM